MSFLNYFSHFLGGHAQLASNAVGIFNRRSDDIDRREKRRFDLNDGIAGHRIEPSIGRRINVARRRFAQQRSRTRQRFLVPKSRLRFVRIPVP